MSRNGEHGLQEHRPVVVNVACCPQYARERHILTNTLKRSASSIPFLLSNAKATAPLIRYVNSTGRLKPTFGEVPPPTHKDKR
ncbi:hypothetical protein M405DRAFT_217379 [Rhizopogon salebrosus TDB-379]|nr:hypothetical protein M405DRAFT_217379 [Rhizopogon salebrosus TDB-379]